MLVNNLFAICNKPRRPRFALHQYFLPENDIADFVLLLLSNPSTVTGAERELHLLQNSITGVKYFSLFPVNSVKEIFSCSQ